MPEVWKEVLRKLMEREEGLFIGLLCPHGHRETVIQSIDGKRARFFCIYDPDDQLSGRSSRRCGFETVVDIEEVSSSRELETKFRLSYDYDLPMPREASMYWRGYVAYIAEEGLSRRARSAQDRSVTMAVLAREFLDNAFVRDSRITGIICPECRQPKGVIRILTADQVLLFCTGNDGYAIEPRSCEYERVITKAELVSGMLNQCRVFFMNGIGS